jgi:hypothetical protein
MDRLRVENPLILDEKLDLLNKELDKVIKSFESQKTSVKLYRKQIIQHSKQSNPVTQQFIKKN